MTDPANPIGHDGLQWLFVALVAVVAAPFAAVWKLAKRLTGRH